MSAADTLSRRGFLRLAGALGGGAAAAALLPACTPKLSGDTHLTASGRPSGLRALYATVEANSAAVESVLPQFREAFGFPLYMDTEPYDALQQNVFSELATKSDYYDIIIVDTPWAPALTHVLEPMAKYIRNPKLNRIAEIDLGDFIPKVFYDGSVFKIDEPAAHFPDSQAAPDVDKITSAGFDILGLPIQANVLTMAYRQDLFDDPKEKAAFRRQHHRELAVPRTLDELVTVGKFFTRPSQHLYGTTVMAGVGDWATCDFKSYLAAFGGDGHMITDDLRMAFDSDAGAKALKFMRDLISTYRIVPPGCDSASWDDTASMFDAGLAAMSSNYHTFALAESVKGGKINYAVVPGGTADGPHFGEYILSINKYSRFKEWAYQAITWLTAAEQQLTMVKKELHPTRASVYDRVKGDKAVTAQSGNFYDVLGKSLAIGVGRPRLTDYTEVSHDIAVAVNNAVAGRTGFDSALSSAASSVRRSLEAANYSVPSK